MASNPQHEIVAAIKQVASELGRTPSLLEFVKLSADISEHKIRITFGAWSIALQAAGLTSAKLSKRQSITPEQKLIKKYESICKKREPIQGFFRTSLDLSELFARAGNPSVLKLSAQPDTHAKFVDRKAFNSYLAFLRYYKPDIHLIMGDFVDCEGLSHWPSDDMEPRRIVPEMKIARGLLQELVDATPTTSTRLYITGNHEDWIEQAFARMPELFDGLAELDIEVNLKTLLGLPKFGYELFPLNELVKIGNAHFTHGLYTGSNHAKKHLDTLKCNIYYAHLHDTLETNQTSIDGNMEAGTFGCLCRLDAKFLKGKPNNWSHAHGAFEFFPDGSYNWYKLRIVNGRCAFNGLVFE